MSSGDRRNYTKKWKIVGKNDVNSSVIRNSKKNLNGMAKLKNDE
jgi:hypothetical protein